MSALAKQRRQINLSVDPRVYDRLEAMAKTASLSVTAYATMLFDAAYCARCKETGDVALDAAVSRVVLLFGTGFDSASIQATTGFSAIFVARTLDAWREAVRRGELHVHARVA